ncbi:MAG: hypothetical protein IE889_06360 [Campylobacterales bacterium]|nr:hypothetical protein [Campylobacterales bacterium]
MDKILPAYHDPLFSIFIIVVMVLVVAVASNVLGNYRKDKQRKNLKDFLGTLTPDECTLHINKVPFEPLLINPLSLLAHTLTTQGEYQKAVAIYLYLIDHIAHFSEKEHLLEALGTTYLKAGFLKRSESVFLEILRKQPRNQTALYSIEVVYELLNDYEKAMQTLKPLEIMGAKPEKLRAHITLTSVIRDSSLSQDQKINRLTAYLEDERYSYRRIIQELFKLDYNRAWDAIREQNLQEILDVLWFLPTSNLKLDIIAQNRLLSSIYTARGVLPLENAVEDCGLFAIDTMIAARRGGSTEVDLNFSYGCNQCKQLFPITFVRCPKCYAINTIQVKESIAKKRTQTGYSLL